MKQIMIILLENIGELVLLLKLSSNYVYLKTFLSKLIFNADHDQLTEK